MDAFRRFTRAPASSESSEVLCPNSSELLRGGGGYLQHGVLEILINQANLIQQAEQPWSAADKEWLADFIQNLSVAMASEQELATKVDSRCKESRKNKIKLTSSSAADQDITIPKSANLQSGSANPGYAAIDNRRPLPPVPIASSQDRIKLNELVNRPERFNGDRKLARRWLDDFESAALANGWNQNIMVKYFSSFLSESGEEWHSGIVQPFPEDYKTWPQLRAKFVRFFLGPEEISALKSEIELSRQSKDEPALKFIARMVRLMIRADPYQSESDRIVTIIGKLSDVYQDKIVGHRPCCLDDLTDLCQEIDTRYEEKMKYLNNKQTQSFSMRSRETKKYTSFQKNRKRRCQERSITVLIAT